MMMYNTICKQYNNTDANICKLITTGFTGILKGWWDNVLTENQRLEIYNARKIIKNENTQQLDITEDAVYTLVQTIILHFIGPWNNQRERSRELLQNLRCQSLTHFRWYKDVFLAKVMQRYDANNEH